jgi:hypothetical protein
LLRVTAVVSAVLLLTACGSSSDPAVAVQSAASKTMSDTAVWILTWTDNATFGRASTPVGERGASIFPRSIAYGALDLSGLAGSRGGTAYLLFLPTKVYLSPASISRVSLPGGKRIVSASLDARTAKAFPQLVVQLQVLNPQFLLNQILWGGVGTTKKGSVVLNHVPLTRYAVSVDLKRAAANATGPTAVPAQLAFAAERAALGSSTSEIRTTVWVNGAGQIARLQTPSPGSGLGRINVSFSGYGAKLTPSLPKASDAVDLLQLTSGVASRSPLVAFATR